MSILTKRHRKFKSNKNENTFQITRNYDKKRIVKFLKIINIFKYQDSIYYSRSDLFGEKSPTYFISFINNYRRSDWLYGWKE